MAFTEDEITARLERQLETVDSCEEALLAGIQTLCNCCHLPYGEVWTCYTERPVLYLKGAWCRSELNLADFVSASQKIALAPGVGLPGRVWQSQRREVIEDLRLRPDFARQTMALAAGFRAALGSPVLCNGEVISVLVCLAPKIDQPLPDLADKIAMMVGEKIFERWPDSLPRRSGDSETQAYLAA